MVKGFHNKNFLFKALISICFILFLCVGSSILYFSQSSFFYSKKNLVHQAETTGYGYKTANLMELSSFTNKISQTNISVAIPEFIGITSIEIETYLKKLGVNIVQVWQQLTKTYFATKQERNQILTSKKFSTLLLKEFQKLQDLLLDSCKKSIDLEKTLPSAHHFMQNCQASQWKLMVRSTGKEDTDTLANAGGNHTEANVPPQHKALIFAIHKVIASYFSEKSLNQRLQAGDQTIFSMPLIPVLIQRMIGETENVIPVGIVAYSQETEGRTPGVTTIQSSFGHNEGVVESSVPIDTYYVSNGNMIYKIIRNKNQRLIPSKNHELAFVQNPIDIQQQQSLPDTAIKATDKLLQLIQKHYQKPMDLELVFWPATNTLYLVQARPIVYSHQGLHPNYLSHTKNSDIIACTTVCSGENQVQYITHKNELIVADTLNQALATYNSMGTEKNTVKGVIVQRNAQPTSHAAAVFRGEGKLVMQTENLNMLSSWLKNTKLNLYADPQRQSLFRSKNQTILDITSGWLNHPLPLQLSINANTPYISNNNLYDSYPNHSYKKLLQLVNRADQATANKALHSLISKITLQLKNFTDAIGTYQDDANLYLAEAAQTTATQLQIILNNINELLPLLTSTLSRPSNDMRRLFHTRFLEALLLQKPTTTIINSISVTATLEQYAHATTFYAKKITPLLEKKVISKQLLKHPKLMTLGSQGAKAAFNTLVQKKWLTFLDKLRIYATPQQQTLLHAMIGNLIHADIFTCWLNTSFTDTYTQVKNKPAKTRTLSCFNILHDEYQESQELITIFSQHKSYFANITQALWEQPQTVDIQLQKFNTHILAFFNSDEFSKLLKFSKHSNNLLQQACLSTMLVTTIERFDSLIKTIKGSTLYPSIETKNIHFKKALTLYLQLLKQFKVSQPLLIALEQTLHNCQITDTKQLINSEKFAVSNVIFFETTYEQEQRRAKQKDADRLVHTLEDVFTSIHQLLLLKISHFILEEWQLDELFVQPTLLKEAEKILSLKKHLAGIRFDKNSITYLYNKQLRAHSVGIELNYSTDTQALTINTTFYGHNEYARWNIIKDYISTASQLEQLTLTTMDQYTTGLLYGWNITDAKSLETIHNCLDNSITTTFRLGIENEKKMYFKNTKVLKNLSSHLTTLAGGPKQLFMFLTKNQSDDHFNIFNLSILPSCNLENSQQETLIQSACKYACTHIANAKLYNLPLSLYAYEQLQHICKTTQHKSSNELNTLIQQIRKLKKQQRRDERA